MFPQTNRLLELLARALAVNVKKARDPSDSNSDDDEMLNAPNKKHPLILAQPHLIEHLIEDVMVLLCCSNVSYREYPLERMGSLIGNLWVLLESTQPSHIRLFLNFLNNVMVDRDDLLSVLKQHGLSFQICMLLRSEEPAISNMHADILRLLTQFVSMESREIANSKIVDITSQMLNNEDRNCFLEFALATAESADPELCRLSLGLLR